MSEKQYKLRAWAGFGTVFTLFLLMGVAFATTPYLDDAKTVAGMTVAEVFAWTTLLLGAGLVGVCVYLVRLLTGLVAETKVALMSHAASLRNCPAAMEYRRKQFEEGA